MSTALTQGTREWGSGGASPVLTADVSSSLLSHPSRPSHRLAADFNAAASPASASSPSLSDIRARLQDVMRTIDTTLDETANPAPLLHQHAPIIDVHRREYRAGPVSGAAAVSAPPPPASSSSSSACRSSSVASAASWSSRHRTGDASGLQSARPSAVTRDTALIPPIATHGAPSRAVQQDDWGRLNGGHGAMHDNTGHRPPIFGQRGKGHGSNSDEDSAATRGTTTASTGLSATYQARLDFWHPAAYHTLPHQSVARGEKSEGVAAGAAPAHSIVSALSSQTTASQYMRPTSRGRRGVGAGAAAAMMQGTGRPSNTVTDTLTSTSVTTDRSSRSSSTASTAAEARRAAHATPQVAGHVPPRTPSVPSALPSLPHPSTVPSLSARLAVLRAADAAQRSALQRPYDVAESAHADPLGMLSTAAEAAAVPAGLSSAASAPPPLLHHDVLAAASCRSTRDAPALSPKLTHGAAPSCTRSPTRRPPATPTPATSPPPSRSRAVVYGINDSQHSDNLVRSPDTRHSSGAGAGAASPSSAERRHRRTTRQAETQRIVELALARQAAAEEAWRESEAHSSTTPTLLLQGNPQRRPPPHPRSASPALHDRSHTALITTAPLDALQAYLTRDGDEGRSSNASAGALAQEGELPMQEELAVRAMLAARRNRKAASLGNGSSGVRVGDVRSERRRTEGRGLGSGVQTPQETRFARFSQPDSKDTLQRRQSVNEAVSTTAAAAAAAVAATRPLVSLPSSPSKAPETPELRAMRAHVEQLARLRERMHRADALPSQQLIKTPDCGRRKPVASTSASNAVGGLSSSSASSTLNIPDVAASAHASRPADAPHRSPPTPQHRTPTEHQATLTTAAAVTLHGIEVEGDVQSSSRSSGSSCGGDGEQDALLSSVSATSVDDRAGTPERAVVVVPAGAKSNSAVRGGRRRVEPPSPRQGRTTRGGDGPGDEMRGERDDKGNSGRLDATQRPSSRPPPPPRTAPQLQTNVEVATASRAEAAGTPPRAHHRVSLPLQCAEPPSPLPVKPPTSSISPSSSLLPRQPRRDAAPNTRDAVGVLQVRASLPVEDAERDIVSSASPSATRPMTTPSRKEAEEGEGCCASLTPERVAALQSVRLHVSPARGTAWQDPYKRQHHRHGSSSSSTSTSSIASAPSPPLSATPPLPLRSTTAAASAPSPPPSSLSPTRGPSPPSQRSPPPPTNASGRALPEKRSQAVDPLLLHQRAVRRDSNRHAVLRAQSMLMEHGVAVEVQLSGRRLPAVVKLSADATELLFYLERAAPVEAAAGSTPTRARQPSVALSPPPSGASSAVSAVAPARSASTGAAPPRFAQPSRTTAAPSSAAILPPNARVRPPPPHVVLQQHAAHQRGSLYSVSPSVRAPPSAPALTAPTAATAVAAPPQPVRLVKVPAGSVMLPGRNSAAEGHAPPAGNVSPRFHTRPPPQSPPSAVAAAAVHPRTSPLSPSASAAQTRTQRRPSPAAPRGMHVRELHHFPCSFARVYVPFGVMGYETDCGMGGPHTWEEVGGMLCGPASFEVLRRYGCPLFAHMRGAAYAPYRVYVIIPEFRRIDVPQDAVLLVLDFKQRVDWVLFLLAMQRNAEGRRATGAAATAAATHAVGAVGGDALSWEGGAAVAALHERANAPLLSYGRALWLLAVQRLQRARALRGLNPFESAVSNRSGSARRRSGAHAAAGVPSYPQRRGLLRGGGHDVGFEAEEREREGRESHPVAVWDAQVIRGAPQQRAPPRAVPTAATAAAGAGAASLRFAAPKNATSPPLRSPRRGRLGGESGAVAAATHVPASQPSALIRSPRPYPSPSVQLGQRHGSSGALSGGVRASSGMRQPERRAAAPAEGIAATPGRQLPNSGAASSVEESNGQQQQQQQQRPIYAEETSKPRFHWLRRVASSLQSSRRGSVSSRRRTASEKG